MGISRKTWLVCVAASVVALALALPAFATVGDSGYMAWDSMGGANGTSPHGGYLTTTQKCVVCHAVHNADPTGELLLNGLVAEACDYCHVGGAGGYTQVYEGDPNNYFGTDYENAHNYWVGGPGVQCTQCHSVHAAAERMTNNAYLTQKILVGSKTWTGTEYEALAQAPLSTDSSDTAITKWCTSCHGAAVSTGYFYYNGYDWEIGDPPGNNAASHVMTTATADYLFPDGITQDRVAWISSNECSSCHASGYTTSAWPHFTDGNRFLLTASDSVSAASGAVDTQEDGVCLRCHSNGTSGVGMSW